MGHNLFISWSGPLSRAIANIVHEWLPTVIQAADPFMSEKDIDAGARGLDEISTQLKDIQVGVMCLTASNQTSAWLNFEAGALSKMINKTYVIPLAFDIDKGQIKQPLGQFQAKQFTESDILQVVITINKAIGSPLKEERLKIAFGMAWSNLAQDIERLRSDHAQQTFVEEPRRTAEDMLEELIVATREQSTQLRTLELRPARTTVVDSQLTVTSTVLRHLGSVYGMDGPMSIKQLATMEDQLDEQDWRTIQTAPFLVWYLENYHEIRYQNRARQPPSSDDMDDVPF